MNHLTQTKQEVLDICCNEMNLMLTELIQLQSIAPTTDKYDAMKPHEISYVILSEIAYGNILSPHFTRTEAQAILNRVKDPAQASATPQTPHSA